MSRRSVVITASGGALRGLREALWDAGLQVEERPLVSVAPPESWGAVDRALTDAARYGSVVFTSPRAVHAVAGRSRLHHDHLTFPAPVWAPPGATAESLAEIGIEARAPEPAEVGRVGAASAVAQAMLAAEAAGPVLFLCGEDHRPELSSQLRAAGLAVDEVVCYRVALATAAVARGAVAGAEWVVVASPRVAELIAAALPPSQRPELLAVGPTTAAAARSLGWEPARVAEQPTVGALAAAARSLLLTP